MTIRSFEDKPAVRERVPLLVGLVGPSGGGKTYSALRLAKGFQRVTGGEVYFIDTEARRALHYADRFQFRHIAFGAPFGPLDYLAAIQHCVAKGAKTIIIDSMSHEHEGPGGVLEMHDKETDTLAKKWNAKPASVQMTAWAKPKGERRRMINSILQIPCNFIFCFRAKQKLKIKKGDDPKQMGFMPIAGEEFVFEMTLNALLMPGANGVPSWRPEEDGERQMVKLPEQFREMFSTSSALSEDIGEMLAKWAEGTAIEGGLFSELKGAIAIASDVEVLKLVHPRVQEVKKQKLLPAGQFNMLMEALKARKEELERAPEPEQAPAEPSGPGVANAEDDGSVPAEFEPPLATGTNEDAPF